MQAYRCRRGDVGVGDRCQHRALGDQDQGDRGDTGDTAGDAPGGEGRGHRFREGPARRRPHVPRYRQPAGEDHQRVAGSSAGGASQASLYDNGRVGEKGSADGYSREGDGLSVRGVIRSAGIRNEIESGVDLERVEKALRLGSSVLERQCRTFYNVI